MKLKTLVKSMALAGVIGLPVATLAASNIIENLKGVPPGNNLDNLATVVNRNQDNVVTDPTSLMSDWFKKFSISGLIQTNAVSGFGSRAIGWLPGQQSGNYGAKSVYQALYLNTAELYIDTQVTDWLSTHATLNYGIDPDVGSNFNSRSGTASAPNTLFVEEASLTIANFEKSPFWTTIGRQYLPFGSYKHNAITKPLSQFLAESNQVAATVGYVSPVGFNADIFVFNGLPYHPSMAEPVHAPHIGSWGADLGFGKRVDVVKYGVSVGYLNNMANNYFINNANPFAPGSPGACSLNTESYVKSVPGMSVHADVSSGPFGLLADYVGALTRFSPFDLPSGAIANLTSVNDSVGAAPWAYQLEGSYKFPVKGYDTMAIIGYQRSGDAVNVLSNLAFGGYWMPEYRYVAGYNVAINKYLSTRFEYYYDTDYSIANGGSGADNNTLMAQLNVIF